MKLVTSNESTSAFADKVAKLVEDAKHNTQWRKQFMDFKHYISQSFNQGKEEGLQEGLQQGLQEGAVKKAMETAANMLRKEYPVSEISEMTGLTQEQILELQKQILADA